MEFWIRDLQYAVKSLLCRPAFASAAIIALGFGIGANTMIFSAVDAVLLQPLPYHDPDQLVWIWENNPTSGIEREPPSYPDVDDWRNLNHSFQDLAAFVAWAPVLTGSGQAERISGALVSPGFFTMLGERPVLGRTFYQDENQPGRAGVVMIGARLWRRRFGDRPDAIGKTITLNETPYEIVGIVRASFEFPNPASQDAPEIWAPIPSILKSSNRRYDFLSVIARLKPGVPLTRARSDMDMISRQLEQLYPETNQGWGVTLISLYEVFTGDVRPAMILLTVAVWLLLIVACANVANLLLVRAGARRREIAVRRALGATQARLMQQFLAESAVIVFAGCVLGVVLATFGIRVFLGLSPDDIPRLQTAGIEVRSLGFSVLVSLLTGVVFGLIPALHTAGVGLNEALKEGSRSSTAGTASRRMRSFLLMVEVAFAVMLLIGSVLLVRSFLKLRRVDPGFNPERVLTAQLILPRKKYNDTHQVISFDREVLQRIQSLPDAEAAAIGTTIPLTGNSSVRDFQIVGRPPLPAGKVNDAEFQVISPQFFQTLGIPLIKGRFFNDLDHEDSTPVAVISDKTAQRYWPGEDPIGHQLTIGEADGGSKLTIVGVVGDVRQSDLSVEPYPQLYVPFSQSPLWETALVIKTQSAPSKIVNEIRDRVASVDPDQPLYQVRPLTEIISKSISKQRFDSQLIGLLTSFALVLTVIGVYSVVSHLADQQLNDIGIRMALGARKKDVLTMIVWQGLSVVLIGVGIGLGLALASTRLMNGLLFGVRASDPITYAIVSLLVATIAMAASYIPAVRAAGSDPAAVLRHE